MQRPYRKVLFSAAAILSFCCVPLLATPVISSPVNQASYVQPGMSGYGIAQGAMFAVFGKEMGPEEIVHANTFPLPTELAETSVQVTVAGETLDCIMVFTSAGQLAAILPSATPLGEGEITVVYQGQTSAPQPILVTANAVGMFAVAQNGQGPAVITDTDFAVNSYVNSFEPGTIAIAWVTGLGARSADNEAAPEDFKETYNVEVGVGGISARVLYAGPSGCCAGVDQIAYELPSLPEEVREGCHVPVVIRARDSYSNFTSMSISSDGPVCGDPDTFLSSEEVSRMHEQGSFGLLTGTATVATATVGPPFGSAVAPLSVEGQVGQTGGVFSFAETRGIELTPFTFHLGATVSGGSCTLLNGLRNAPDTLEETDGAVFALQDGVAVGQSPWIWGAPEPPSALSAIPNELQWESTRPSLPRGAVSYDLRGDSRYKVDVSYAVYADKYSNPIDTGVTTNDWNLFRSNLATDQEDEVIVTAIQYFGELDDLLVKPFVICVDSSPGPFVQGALLFDNILAAEVTLNSSFAHPKSQLETGSEADAVFLNIQNTIFRQYSGDPGPTIPFSSGVITGPDGVTLEANVNVNNLGLSIAAAYNDPLAEGWEIVMEGETVPIMGGPLTPGQGAFEGTLSIQDWPTGQPTPGALARGKRDVFLNLRGSRIPRFGYRFHF